MHLDGNGWVDCRCGARHWGQHGAAGLYLCVDHHVLLQLRPGWAHQGGTWAIPGGARDSHESVIAAALREAQEETALDVEQVNVSGVHRLQHPDWRYDTVLATAPTRPVVSEHAESVRLAWVPVSQVSQMDLHPGFAASLPALQLPQLRLIIDAANVIGSVPDGWWRDRVAATERLLTALEPKAGQVITWDGRQHLLSHLELVVEGQARAVPDRGLDSLVYLTRAPAAGDEMIAERARSVSAVVVTSDRGLQARVARSASVSQFRKAVGV